MPSAGKGRPLMLERMEEPWKIHLLVRGRKGELGCLGSLQRRGRRAPEK